MGFPFVILIKNGKETVSYVDNIVYFSVKYQYTASNEINMFMKT